LTSADLDACHGKTSVAKWAGRKVKMYHFVATVDFPYTIGCLRGRFDRSVVRAISGPPPRRRGTERIALATNSFHLPLEGGATVVALATAVGRG
jgi:hypothetical protein